MKNFFDKIKIFVSSLFYGFRGADEIIVGQSSDINDNVIGIHQVKDIHRVAPALLKGEVTQEVVDLRYRDYLVSEGSRYFDKNDCPKNAFIREVKPTKFGGYNHELCNGIGVESNRTHTLKIEYNNNIKFRLEKYCDRFTVDGTEVKLYFQALPNRNVVTSKAFINYISKMPFSSNFGGEYSRLKSLDFTTYKIANVKNYLKFTFFDLLLTEYNINDDNDIVLTYKSAFFKIDDLTKKYISEGLQKKYENKEAKHLPQDCLVYDIDNKCSICGKSISQTEGDMNRNINGKFCCTDCLCKELLKKENEKIQ